MYHFDPRVYHGVPLFEAIRKKKSSNDAAFYINGTLPHLKTKFSIYARPTYLHTVSDSLMLRVGVYI